MSEAESKRAIEQALRAFAAQPLKAAAIGLFIALGYESCTLSGREVAASRNAKARETRGNQPSLRREIPSADVVALETQINH